MALFILFLGSFCLGTAEFMATGLLPQVAADLGISIPAAGTIVTAYALGVAFGGPVLAVLLGGLPRKTVLIGLIALFAAAQVLAAFAPSFELLLAARVLGAACQGAFLGIAGLVAVSVAGPGRSGFALSLLVAGFTVANILGLPGGTIIGSAFGWRLSFLALGAIAVIVALLVLLLVPAIRSETGQQAPLARQFRALAHRDVILSYAVMALASIGFFSIFTFITPLLTTVTKLDATTVPALLLAFGIGSTAGALTGGRLADWRPTPSVIVILLGEIAVFATILVASDRPVPMMIAVIVLGFCAFAYAPSLFVRLFTAAKDAPDLASTLISTAFNIGIATGSTLGAVALANGASYPSLAWIGIAAAGTAIVAVLAMAISREDEPELLAQPAE
ncbi:MFS transporter [Devosia sp. CN2-171]|uniref:MFS transporter n=1 Tax=Devosia sp. CN2-171 TaxID=3400909 RepID=UPI003BF87387